MGKGDKKTKRGKIVAGSYGVSRKKKNKKPYKPEVAAPALVKEKPVTEKKAEAIVKAKVDAVAEEKLKAGKVKEEQVEAQAVEKQEPEPKPAEIKEEKPVKKPAAKKAPAKAKAKKAEEPEKEEAAE